MDGRVAAVGATTKCELFEVVIAAPWLGIGRSWHSAVFSGSVYFAQGKNFATAAAMIR